VPGPAGLDCWDLNGNGEPDPEEDRNGDGVWDAMDCQGDDGTDGVDGLDGANCYDGLGDYNGDGVVDAQDCRDFAKGEPGADGSNCYDTIGDYNNDGSMDGQDCLDWVLDQIVIETIETVPVIASGFIDSFGYLQRGHNILGLPMYVDVGEFEVTIDLAGTHFDLDDPSLLPEHFPVFITVWATSADPLPWSDNIGALVAHYKFDDATSLDRVNETLTMRVYILRAQDGMPTGASFSIMVLEP